MVLFKVKAKDTYYSIGRRYNIKPEALMKFNGKSKASLSIGAIVEVPTEIPFKRSSKEKEAAETPKKETKAEKKEKLAEETKAEKKHKKIAEEQTDETTSAAPVQQQQTVPEPVVQQPVQQPVQQTPPPDAPIVQYKVSAGETLYAISKRFNTTVDDITKLNNLTTTTVQPGQVLQVHSVVATPQPPPAPVVQPAITIVNPVAKRDSTTMVAVNKDSSNSEHHLNANRFGLFEKNEKGVATWMNDEGLDPNKKLVLHRTAPIGTVIKITNPMTNRTTFAKVVGRFTDSESTKDVLIVMTKSVADALGAMDKRFHVDISYGSPNE